MASAPTLRSGHRGPDVARLQALLIEHGSEIKADGDFGPKTEAAVERFQEDRGLYADGIVGTMTWAELLKTDQPRATRRALSPAPGGPPVRVKISDPPGGYTSLRMRGDAAEALSTVFKKMVAVGAQPTTSGGLRSLRAKVSPNRSATSMHYLGLAVDLWVGAAFVRPHRDPYIVCREAGRHWRVYAKASQGEGRTLNAVRSGLPEAVVTQNVIDLTALMEAHGFKSIRSRPSSWNKIATDHTVYMGTEWWHFQYEEALEVGDTFGEHLLRLYTQTQLRGSPPWKFRDRQWNGQYFAKA